MQNKLSDWVIFPRQLTFDFIEGRMKPAEFLLHCALRGRGDPYGNLRTSLSDIRYDVFKGKGSDNYVNRLLISLKKKKYLYFERRSGRKGSFVVSFGDWILSDGSVRSLDHLFSGEGKDATSNTTTTEQPHSVSQRTRDLSQRSNDIKNDISQFLKDIPFD